MVWRLPGCSALLCSWQETPRLARPAGQCSEGGPGTPVTMGDLEFQALSARFEELPQHFRAPASNYMWGL